MKPALKTKLNINISNYSGPLEVLLDLAKAQKVDLKKISITQLYLRSETILKKG